jgi:hypothetical protein
VILISFPTSSIADRALVKTAAITLARLAGKRKARRGGARPGFQRDFRGYLFVPESRYIVKIFVPSVLWRRFVGDCRST